MTRVPLIVDADTGFGSALNVMRTVRELEGARCAAIQLEDQVDQRCGHLEGTRVVESEIFAEKVRAAATSRQHLVVVARTDARATLGFEAVRRGLEYWRPAPTRSSPRHCGARTSSLRTRARCPARSWRT